jgi:hypothetical protein
LQAVRPVLLVQVPERVLRLLRRCLLQREPELREPAQVRLLERNLLQELQRELPVQALCARVLRVPALDVVRERPLEPVRVCVQERLPEPVRVLHVQERLPEPVLDVVQERLLEPVRVCVQERLQVLQREPVWQVRQEPRVQGFEQKRKLRILLPKRKCVL